MLNDVVTRTCQPIHPNQIDARLAHLVPGVECAERIIRHKPRGREEPPRILVRRIARQCRRRQIRGVRPSALDDTNTRELPERGVARARERRHQRAFGTIQIAPFRLPYAFGNLLVAGRRRCDRRCTLALGRAPGRRSLDFARGWRCHDEHPSRGRRPSPVKIGRARHPEGRASGIVKDHAIRVSRDNDDIVIGAGVILDERDDRSALLELAGEGLGRPWNFERAPVSGAKVRRQRVRADAACFPVDERLK